MTYSPKETRQLLLDSAFQEIYQHGFQGTGLAQILNRARLTKGALYHHFKNKEELGYALIDDYLVDEFYLRWIQPLNQADDPIATIKSILETDVSRMKACLDQGVQKKAFLGCPLFNLAQEMSGVSDDFRGRVSSVFQIWIDAVSLALKRGQNDGLISKSVSTDAAARFIVGSIEGVIGLVKTFQDINVGLACMEELNRYLDGLS